MRPRSARPPRSAPPHAPDARIGTARHLAASILAAGLVLAPTEAPAEAPPAESPIATRTPLVAERITAGTDPALRVGGVDAEAGVDDWLLSNGTLCAAISDPTHESPLVPRGGVLVDLGHCGAPDDQWAVLQPMLNLTQDLVVPISEVEGGADASHAWIRTRALLSGVEIETTYRVGLDEPSVLDVAMHARRVAPGERLFALGAVALHPNGRMRPFSIDRHAPERSTGFDHPPSDRRSLRSLLGALVPPDLTVLVGGAGLPPIAYGLEHRGAALIQPDGEARVGAFAVTGEHFTFLSALARPPWIGEPTSPPGALQLLQLPFMDLEPGEVLALELRLRVGERADVASITDPLLPPDAPRLRGRVDDPDAHIAIEHESGAPITEIAPDSEGRFGFRLAPGRYRARARAPFGREARVELEVPATVAAAEIAGLDHHISTSAEIAMPELALGRTGFVEWPDAFVGRLVFLPEDGRGPLVFGAPGLPFRLGEEAIPDALEAPFVNVAPRIDPTATARPRLALPAGRHRVLAVRGPEYAAAEVTVDVRPGRTSALPLAALARLAPTEGWIAADLHVHSGVSFDSGLPPARQIEAFAASGAEVLVATEHDRVRDPRPAIRARGLEGMLVGMTGVEATSSFEGGDSPHSGGHFNAFPMEVDPLAARGGAPAFEGRRLRDVLQEVRQRRSAPFIQLNHPRPDPTDAGDDTFFEHLGVVGEPFDPRRPLDAHPNAVLLERAPTHGGRDLDFDAMELMNASSLERYRRIRADWLALLLQGERKIATANSDSHRLGHVVGLPRTYVAVDDDRVEAFDEARFVASLRAGRAFGTTGPLLSVRLDEAGLGDLHAGGTGILHVAVEAAPWVPVAEWRAYVDGELVHRAPIEAGASASLPLVFPRDAFVTVEVEGPATGLYAEALPGFVPFAFTNPIYVDADGDGRWQAPGWPDRLPRTIRDPLGGD
ncbi:MAG: CehA/McbA family metallohydrolase [Spirochaetaceae bacterium]|nr:CehA/McbA family metallohydrolase [Spirochaetaceae bacterium]